MKRRDFLAALVVLPILPQVVSQKDGNLERECLLLTSKYQSASVKTRREIIESFNAFLEHPEFTLDAKHYIGVFRDALLTIQ